MMGFNVVEFFELVVMEAKELLGRISSAASGLTTLTAETSTDAVAESTGIELGNDGYKDGADDGANDGADDGANEGADDGANDGVDDGANDGVDDADSTADDHVVDFFSRIASCDFIPTIT